MNNVIALRIFGCDTFLLGLLVVYRLLCILQVVFFFRCNLFRLLLVLSLTDGSESGFLSFYLTHNRFQSLISVGCRIIQYILDKRVVAVQYKRVGIWHLSVETHSSLETTHVFHTAHILVLCDDDRLSLFTKRLYLHIKFDFVKFWQL